MAPHTRTRQTCLSKPFQRVYVKHGTHPELTGTCRNHPEPTRNHPEPTRNHPEPPGTTPNLPGTPGTLTESQNNKNQIKVTAKQNNKPTRMR